MHYSWIICVIFVHVCHLWWNLSLHLIVSILRRNDWTLWFCLLKNWPQRWLMQLTVAIIHIWVNNNQFGQFKIRNNDYFLYLMILYFCKRILWLCTKIDENVSYREDYNAKGTKEYKNKQQLNSYRLLVTLHNYVHGIILHMLWKHNIIIIKQQRAMRTCCVSWSCSWCWTAITDSIANNI